MHLMVDYCFRIVDQPEPFRTCPQTEFGFDSEGGRDVTFIEQPHLLEHFFAKRHVAALKRIYLSTAPSQFVEIWGYISASKHEPSFFQFVLTDCSEDPVPKSKVSRELFFSCCHTPESRYNDATSHSIDVRLSKGFYNTLQPMLLGDDIIINEYENLSVSKRYPVVQAAGLKGSFLSHKINGKPVLQLACGIGATSIYDDHLEVTVGLIEERAKALVEEGFSIQCCDDD